MNQQINARKVRQIMDFFILYLLLNITLSSMMICAVIWLILGFEEWERTCVHYHTNTFHFQKICAWMSASFLTTASVVQCITFLTGHGWHQFVAVSSRLFWSLWTTRVVVYEQCISMYDSNEAAWPPSQRSDHQHIFPFIFMTWVSLI